MPHRREVAVARMLGRLRRCRRQRTVGHDDISHNSRTYRRRGFKLGANYRRSDAVYEC